MPAAAHPGESCAGAAVGHLCDVLVHHSPLVHYDRDLAAGASWTEIAAEAGCDWRVARKYLSPDAPTGPPTGSPRAGTRPRLVDPYRAVIDGWLASEPRLRASVIHERLVAN